jgi:cytoskeleton protein RodZ
MTEAASPRTEGAELTHVETTGESVHTDVAGAADVGASAGLLLRQAREAAGLHIAALAASLKVPVKKLEALETDQFDLLPDAVFVRALAASVCRTLKVDADPILALLPQTGKPRLGLRQTAINTPFRAPGDGPAPSLWTQISRPAVLTVLLLLMGSLVLIFLPPAQQGGLMSLLTPDAPVAPARSQLVAAEAVVAPLAAVKGPGPMAAPSTAPALAPATAVAATLVSPKEPAPTGIIVFRANSESWVEVTDAKKGVVLRRMLAAGEEVGATGVLPLSAVVGRSDVTQVRIRGQAFDLAPVSKDNVARFEVK